MTGVAGENLQFDVSVVIAARNEAEYIKDAVLSVLNQADVFHELIFVDDSSTDNTFEIVENLAKLWPNLRVLRNPKQGKTSAFNFGVASATGRWLCIFAGDDIMPEGSLTERLHAVTEVKSDKPIVGLSKLVTWSDDPSKDGVVLPKAQGVGGFTGTSYFMSRTAVEFLFPVPEDLPNEDTWLEIGVRSFDFTLVHSDIVSNRWRVHAGNSVPKTLPFEEFNKRYSMRMRAASLFYDKYAAKLSPARLEGLTARIECEDGRRSGNYFRIAFAKVSLRDKLRAIALSSALLYRVRQRYYALFSS